MNNKTNDEIFLTKDIHFLTIEELAKVIPYIFNSKLNKLQRLDTMEVYEGDIGNNDFTQVISKNLNVESSKISLFSDKVIQRAHRPIIPMIIVKHLLKKEYLTLKQIQFIAKTLTLTDHVYGLKLNIDDMKHIEEMQKRSREF